MPNQYRIRNKTATVTPADGVSNILCRSIDGEYFFRVYHKQSADNAEDTEGDHADFADYKLAHLDLTVTIHDSYPDKQVLDYDPQVYGFAESE